MKLTPPEFCARYGIGNTSELKDALCGTLPEWFDTRKLEGVTPAELATAARAAGITLPRWLDKHFPA